MLKTEARWAAVVAVLWRGAAQATHRWANTEAATGSGTGSGSENTSLASKLKNRKLISLRVIAATNCQQKGPNFFFLKIMS